MAVVRRTLQRYNPLRHMPDEPFFYHATGSIAALYGLPGIEHHASASCNSQTQHAAPQYPAAYVPCSTSLTRIHVARRRAALFEKSCRSKKSSCVRQHAERKDYEVGLLKIIGRKSPPPFIFSVAPSSSSSAAEKKRLDTSHKSSKTNFRSPP